MYDLVNLSNKEVKYHVMFKRRREEIMNWRENHTAYVAAEKRRRRLEMLGGYLAVLLGAIAFITLFLIL